MPDKEARDLVLLASFMLRDVFELNNELRSILAPIEAMSGSRRGTVWSMQRGGSLRRGKPAGEPSQAPIDAIETKLLRTVPARSGWAT